MGLVVIAKVCGQPSQIPVGVRASSILAQATKSRNPRIVFGRKADMLSKESFKVFLAPAEVIGKGTHRDVATQHINSLHGSLDDSLIRPVVKPRMEDADQQVFAVLKRRRAKQLLFPSFDGSAPDTIKIHRLIRQLMHRKRNERSESPWPETDCHAVCISPWLDHVALAALPK
jgi:hypothetical protein